MSKTAHLGNTQNLISSSPSVTLIVETIKKSVNAVIFIRIYNISSPRTQFNSMIKGDNDPEYQSTIINDQNTLNDSENIIRLTRNLIKDMSETQRFQKAKAHVNDALAYRRPRPQSQSLSTPLHFRRLYAWQTSAAWQWLLFLLGYTFMYLVIMDKQSYAAKIAVESTILFIFWTDTLISAYLKLFDTIGKHRFSLFFKFRIVLLALMTIDLIIFIALPGFDSRPIRPFRVLRCLIPMLYDPEKKRTFFSLISAYKDILVYFIFFGIVICGWALIGSRALTFDPTYVDPNFPQNVDPYKSNYSDLGKMIFVVYVLATYDSYPDNDILAIQNFQPNYIYFIIFIFMNMFLFSSIPGSLIYLKFRQTRSKIILIDQIRQQHSLILAFVTLADAQKQLSTDKLIKFLLYLYRYKIRYVEYITDICLKLDDNNSKSIQVNQFNQLSKIILQNKAMTPPAFDDIEVWVKFRRFFNVQLHLKSIIKHWIFEGVVSIIIVLSFINAIFFIYNYSALVQTFDTIFIWIFAGQLIIRILAIGPENFFSDRWNNVDTLLVAVGVTFFFVPIKNNADSIVRMSRIFRIASLLRLISHSNFLQHYKFQTLQKLKKIFSVILEILPIILKFMPLFLVFFYIYGIVGMQIFYNSYTTTGVANYNQYQQFSSFRSFIQSQYIMVQVLTEAGWSMVAFDHSWRNPQYFGYIMVYFCIMHITIVYIVATLIKGMFWQVFFTVNGILQQRQAQTIGQELKDLQNQEMAAQLAQINKLIATDQYIDPNTILKRELYQNKLDKEIFMRLKTAKDKLEEQRRDISSSRKIIGSKKELVSKIMDNYKIQINELDVSEDIKSKYGKDLSDSGKKLSNKFIENKQQDFDQIKEVAEEDFQSQIQQIFDQVILNPKARYSYIIGQNKIFIQFLKSKFIKAESLINLNSKYFNLQESPLANKQSMVLHIYQMHSILNIETSKREQKVMIINNLFEEGLIDQRVVDNLIRKRLNEKIFNIDTNGTLRKMFLSETNQDLIKKFEVQYFSDLYGHSFKQINKMTLQPLLKVEATLTYSLRNIMRYPQINNTQFFEMLTHIEDQISNKLLQRGSLFKFVYKLDAPEEIWFSIQYKHQQQMRVHFIKTGVWASYKEMENNQVYYAKDVFNCNASNRDDSQLCQRFIKRFYQSFEGLAFSLLDEKKFFEVNPQTTVYDLFVQSFDAQQIKRYITKENQISKIMVVILSKEQERKDIGEEKLPYSLTDLIVKPKKRHDIEFTLDDTQNETYDKLKNFAAQDHEKIVESEGLPLAYIINLMRQILDILNIYGNNFIFQIEKVLNEQYELMNKRSNSQQGKQMDEKKEMTKKLKIRGQSLSMFL